MNIPYLPSIVNAVILTSLFSTANSFVFVGSRTLYGLGKAGHAPKVVTRLNRNGVPYVSVLITLALGCLSYLAMSAGTYKGERCWRRQDKP
jgi:amino acid transporter